MRPALGAGFHQGLDRRGGYGQMFSMNRVVAEVFRLDRRKSAGADMQGDGRNAHAIGLQLC